MKLPFKVLFLCLGGLLLISCGDDDSSDGSYYDGAAAFEFGNSSSSSSRVPGLESFSTTCGGTACLTPSNIEGRIYAGNLMVGGNGGATGYAVTIIADSDEVRQRPDQGKDGTITFNLAEATEMTARYSVSNDGPIAYPSDSEAVVTRLENNWDYIDTTVTVPGSAGSDIANNSYTIRVVYVTETTVTDIVSGESTTVYQGDKLVKVPGSSTFKWCDSSACTYTTRPSSPLQDSNVADYTLSGEGNENYVNFSISLGDDPITFTFSDATTKTWTFNMAFDLTNAAVFDTAFSSLSSVVGLVDAFALVGDPGSASISVALTKTESSEVSSADPSLPSLSISCDATTESSCATSANGNLAVSILEPGICSLSDDEEESTSTTNVRYNTTTVSCDGDGCTGSISSWLDTNGSAATTAAKGPYRLFTYIDINDSLSGSFSYGSTPSNSGDLIFCNNVVLNSSTGNQTASHSESDVCVVEGSVSDCTAD